MQTNQKIKKLKVPVILPLLLFLSFVSNAQEQNRAANDLVVYDPLVWKNELKLNAEQRQEIQKINTEFYQSMYEAAVDSKDHKVMQAKANQYLQQRSQEIWEAFSPSQRKKWKRLWDHYSS
ncbi:MAG TPA: hypothetical protein PLJ60_02645 [Chryseolinea sp.]|nr:hypothetical protein [Chryseolinea sp.]HPM29210.1 hypothetical protein [Chryseolinea sp.]